MNDEGVTYSDARGNLISRSRAILNGATYSMANVTSVRTGYRPAPRAAIWLLAIFGILLAAGHIYAIAAFLLVCSAVIFVTRNRDGSWSSVQRPVKRPPSKVS